MPLILDLKGVGNEYLTPVKCKKRISKFQLKLDP